ncbi:MAG TPA: arylesterase [Gammaproteobacteria bacterium]
MGFTAESTASKTPVILVLGDSLSASFGIDQSIGWASLLEHKLTLHNYNYRVVNASISGETTQGGLQRLPGLLAKYQPRLVILELGGNDGLRGLSIDMISTNLQTMISKTRGFPADILLLGMRLPPNYGAFYTERFQQMYVDLGTANNIPVVPFLLKGIATREDLMQADGIHPKAQAQPLVLENVWEILKPRLTQTQELTEQQTQ